MIFLMMAAHDTSTITLSTAMQYLGQFPEWQQRCREESDALGTTTPSFDRLDELTSLDLVIKECQRLVTPVPGVVRRAAKDTEILGHFVPKGTLLNLGMHFSHHMPELWPDPERFDPERFSPERREDKVHKYAWAPSAVARIGAWACTSREPRSRRCCTICCCVSAGTCRPTTSRR